MKYLVPKLEDFRVGFKYEKFETEPNDKYIDKDGHFKIKGFKIYSDEYFDEMHSNDKYWKHRKWVNKTATQEDIYFINASTFYKQKYTPLNIENIYRISKESMLTQLEGYYIKAKERFTML